MNSTEPNNLVYISYDELQEIILIIKNRFDFDFSQYTKSSLKRRFERILNLNQWSLYDLKSEIINNVNFINDLKTEITVNVTEMFRDATLFNSLREKVVPYLYSYPNLKIWHPGVSTGEELYSFSILLESFNLYERSFFYGTDINEEVLKIGRNGIYSLSNMKSYSENYYKIGLENPFSNYYTVKYDHAILNSAIKKNSLFSVHNLISDGVFNEFQLVVCRNVLIYFEQELQDRVINLMIDSLCPLGFLILGSKESIRSPKIRARLNTIDSAENIFQKIY